MIGERLRQARLRAGLTQEEVVGKLAALMGISLTKAGLSKYEKGGSLPKPSLLMALARVLGVRGQYFLAEPRVQVEWLAFRKSSSLGKKEQERIQALALAIVENQVWLQEKMFPGGKSSFPKSKRIGKPEDAERAAEALRGQWKLGEQPIESVTQTIEDRGGVVVECTVKENEFHGLAGWASDKYPVLVVNGAASDDRKRFSLAHELGHLAMECEGVTEKEEESLAHRFAGAFLVPRAVVIRELGERRRSLSFDELALLKRKHGLSMQAWIRRARDLGVIDESHYNTLCKQFSKNRWRKNEPVRLERPEKPVRLQLMTLQALAEGIVTPEKAEALCPGLSTREAGEAGTRSRPSRITATELLKRPLAERKWALSKAADLAEKDYREGGGLRGFDAFGEEDLHDESD